MNSNDIANSARAAGAAGTDYMTWAADAVVLNFVMEHGADSESWEAAHREGYLEYLRGLGWVERYTTAPESYDTRGVETVEQCGEWKGKDVRRALYDPEYLTWHEYRYGSGLHGMWSENPREADERRAADAARLQALREQDAARRAEGLAWLASLDLDELKRVYEDPDQLEVHGVRYPDLRAELTTKRAAAEQVTRVALQERCRAIIPVGATLVDDGTPGTAGYYGWIPGRPASVMYGIGYPAFGAHLDPRETYVVDSRGDRIAPLTDVADWIESGRLRIATEGEVPPEAVARRIGLDRFKDIVRVPINRNRCVWVAYELRIGTGLIVLNEHGRKVRAAAVVDTARAEYYKHRAAYYAAIEASEGAES